MYATKRVQLKLKCACTLLSYYRAAAISQCDVRFITSIC